MGGLRGRDGVKEGIVKHGKGTAKGVGTRYGHDSV